MLVLVFVSELFKSVTQRLLIAWTINCCFADFLHVSLLLVVLTELCYEFAQKYGTSVAKNSTILLGTMSCHIQGALIHYTTFKHKGAWLENRYPLPTHLCIEVGSPAP